MSNEDIAIPNAPRIEIRTASDPFNSREADITLRTSDHVDFRVKKSIVSDASPVFEEIFSTVPPSSDNESIPVISASEHSNTLDALLRYCYAVDRPAVEPMDHAQEIVKAATRYGVKEAIYLIRNNLYQGRLMDSEPGRCFALACQYAWKKETRRLARYSLKTPLLDLIDCAPEHLRQISGEAYAQFLQYHRQCEQAAAQVAEIKPLADFRWLLRDDYVFLSCDDCEYLDYAIQISRPGVGKSKHPRRIERKPRKWWVEYMKAMETELRRRPDSSTVTNEKVLLVKCIEKANECLKCKYRASGDMQKLIVALAEQVDKAISQVELRVPFPQMEET